MCRLSLRYARPAGFQEIQNIKPLGAGEFNRPVRLRFGREGVYALKIAPDARTLVMTYEKDMIRSEIFWYKQLRAHTDITTPEIVHTDCLALAAAVGLYYHGTHSPAGR